MACLILSGRAAEERGEGNGWTGHFLVCNSTSDSMKSLSVVCEGKWSVGISKGFHGTSYTIGVIERLYGYPFACRFLLPTPTTTLM